MLKTITKLRFNHQFNSLNRFYSLSFDYRIQSWPQRSAVNLRFYSDDEKNDKKEKSRKEKPKDEKRVKDPEASDRLRLLLKNFSVKSASTDVKIPKPEKKKPKPVEKEEKLSDEANLK
jgi:hypothetical protein